MVFEQKFTWNEENKELTETKIGDQVVDQRQQKVDARFENKVIYPHATAINLVKELENQLADMKVHLDAEKDKIKGLVENSRKVDEIFFEKFKACQAKLQIHNAQVSFDTNKMQMDSVKKQLDEIKKVMKRD